MDGAFDRRHSLHLAIEHGRDEALRSSRYDSLPQKFLEPGEHVYFALEGNGWSWVKPLTIVTDRRVMHLRESVLGRWSKRQEIAPGAVTGSKLSTGLFFGSVTVFAGGAAWLRTSYDRERQAKDFVDGLNGLIARGGSRP